MAQKGKRLQTRMRIALTGPQNAGKTYSALVIAYGVVKANFPDLPEEKIWDKIFVIDTERGRALYYIDRNDLPTKTGAFYHTSISAPYDTKKYMDAVAEGVQTVGPDGVVIIDSISHAWGYAGGILEKHQEEVNKGKNSFTSWNESGKIQNKFIDSILDANTNIIVTMRSKPSYVLETNNEGKTVPKKVGLAPIQRDDLEYEFDIVLMLDDQNLPKIIKDVTFLKSINFNEVITPKLGYDLITWLKKGMDITEYQENLRQETITKIKEIVKTNKGIEIYLQTAYPNISPKDLTLKEAQAILAEIKTL